MTEGRVFLDTNVLVYAYDNTAGHKQETARQILQDLWDRASGVLSTQVLQEFFVQVTKKIPKPLEPLPARLIVSDLLTWEVVVNDGTLILSAIDLQLTHRLSFWDAMILQAALRAGADRVYSEDLSHGQSFGRMSVLNPFRAAPPTLVG